MAETPTVTPTVRIPLTTVFIPPTECTTKLTIANPSPSETLTGWLHYFRVSVYEGENAGTCFPSLYRDVTAGYSYYTPGICPHDYATATSFYDGREMRAICCSTGYTIEASGTIDWSSRAWHPCVTSLPSAVMTRILESRGTWFLADPVTYQSPVFAAHDPLPVAWQATDLSRFPEDSRPRWNTNVELEASAADSLVQVTRTEVESGVTSVPDIRIDSIATLTNNAAPTISDVSTETGVSLSRGLSQQARIGVGVGLGAAFLFIFAGAYLLVRRKRRFRHLPEAQTLNGWNMEQHDGMYTFGGIEDDQRNYTGGITSGHSIITNQRI